MTTRPPEDFTQLPPSTPLDATTAYQVDRDEPPRGPEGGGGDGDADGD